jgi:hypothetical protein
LPRNWFYQIWPVADQKFATGLASLAAIAIALVRKRVTMKPNRTEIGFSAWLNRRKKQLDDRFRLVIPDWGGGACRV